MKIKIIALVTGILLGKSVFAQQNIKDSFPPLSVDSFAAKINRQQNPQIIDVRTPEEYLTNHIIGAINIDLKSPDYSKIFQTLNKTQPVFIYAIQNYRPGLLAKELRSNGFTEVYELKSGIANWIGAGNPYYSLEANNISVEMYNKLTQDNRILLVDIGTKYCGLCVKAKQIVDSVQEKNDGSFTVQYIDLYKNPLLVSALKEVQAVPTILLYKAGKIIWKRTGLTFNKNDIEAEIAKAK